MPSFSATPNSLPPSASASTVTLQGQGTSWAPGTTFTIAGKAGASLGAVSVNAAAQSATLALTPGAGPGTILVANSADASTATVEVGITHARPPRWAPRRR